MTHRIATALELHPTLGWLASLGSMFMGWLTWLLEHSSSFAQGFAVGAGLFGVAAGYYTFRIQRRTWQRMQRDDESGNDRKAWD